MPVEATTAIKLWKRLPEALGLITGQPGVHRDSMHAELLGYHADPHPFSDDGQDGVISLFHLAELPEYSASPASGRSGLGH
jgi:hypothetical protein